MPLTGFWSNTVIRTFVAWAFLLAIWQTPCHGQPQTEDPVAAVVGDARIFVSQVDFEYARKFEKRELGDALKTHMRFQILKRLCNQQLVLNRLVDSDLYATDDEVNLQISQLKERLAQIETNLEEYLAKNNQSEACLRFNMRWQISWKRYLDQTLTDKNLESFFNRNRTRFDGTRFHMAQLLLELPDLKPASIQEVNDQAIEILAAISDSTISWNEAVKKHSIAPSNATGGDLGWIDYKGPLSRNLIDASMRMQAGETSQPIQTPFGIHLLHCLEVKPGTASWYDVRQELKPAAAIVLFDKLVAKQSPETPIRLLDTVADPGQNPKQEPAIGKR